jgi:urea transport system permease protein
MRARRELVATLAVWAGLAGAPLVLDEWSVSQLAIFVTYGIFAMSLAVIWGQVGLLCFGQAVWFGIGAYAMGLTTLGQLPYLEATTSSWLGLLLAVALPAMAANVIGRFLFYGRGLQGAYFAIVTLAIAIIAERIANQSSYLGGFNGLIGIPPFDLGGGLLLLDPLPTYYAALAVAFLVFVLLEALIRSPWGTVLRAIRGGEDRTRFFGYDVAAYKLSTFTLSAALAGLSGGIFVTQFGFASPSLIGFALSTEVLIWVALGGKTVLIAALLGAIVVRWAGSWLSETLGAYWPLALGLLFILSIVLLPKGLIGQALVWISDRGEGARPRAKGDRQLAPRN